MSAPVGIVVDVMRASSCIVQALASGYERILCTREADEARAVRETVGEGLLAGERDAIRIEGFDVGGSPREFRDGHGETVILSTTNGTRAIVHAAESCEHVLIGSLLNLDAVVAEARKLDGDIVLLCAGFKGAFAIDDAYCAGRILLGLEGERSDAAVASEVMARAFPDASDGINARTYGPPGLEEDIAWVSQVNLLAVVPRFTRMIEGAAEIRL